MKLLIVLVLFCGAMARGQTAGVWKTCTERSYVFYPEPMSWANAQLKCLEMGGHLAVINSKEEEDTVQGLAGGKDASERLSDAQKDCFWFCINSEPLGYTNWCPGEPNNHKQNQKCALTNHNKKKCWDDQDCDRLHPLRL